MNNNIVLPCSLNRKYVMCLLALCEFLSFVPHCPVGVVINQNLT